MESNKEIIQYEGKPCIEGNVMTKVLKMQWLSIELTNKMGWRQL